MASIKTVTVRDGRLCIEFPYELQTVALVKTLDGRKYDPSSRLWMLPVAGSMPSLRRLKVHGFLIDGKAWEAAMDDEQAALENDALAALPDTAFETPLPLFPYQRVGAAFIDRVGSGLLGDEMGLGKTVQAIAVVEHAGAGKVLVLVPSSVKWQWKDEIARFLPAAASVVIDGDKDARAKQWQSEARFYIANYELLLRDFPHISAREWDVIVADEATKISNPSAKTVKALKKLKAKRRIAMTGTPVSNRANEVWSIIDFCVPGAMGNYYSFVDRYCMKNKWGGIFGYRNMDELAGKLKRHMIRRRKEDVLPELPEKIVTDVPFTLSAEESATYKNLKKEILFEIEKELIDKIDNPMTIQYTLVKMLRLQQIADSMELVGQKTESSKLAVLKEMMGEALDGNDRKAIVFTRFAEMADILERELAAYGPLKISGKVTESYGDVMKKFNDDPSRRVLVMTSAGQFGLNVQRASVIFHYDCEWSLAKMLQRDGRAHRYGQKDTVMVYYLLAKGTVDYYVRKVLLGKAELSQRVLGEAPIGADDIKAMLEYE